MFTFHGVLMYKATSLVSRTPSPITPRVTFYVQDRRYLVKEEIFAKIIAQQLRWLTVFCNHWYSLETGNVSDCCVFILRECTFGKLK